MADQRDLVAQLARALIELYADLQRRLAADLARRLADGIDSPTWAEEKLAAIGAVRRWAETLLARLNGPLGDTVAQTAMLAYMRGGQAALAELSRVQSSHRDWLALARLNDPGPRLREMIARRQSGLLAELGQVATRLPGTAAINRLVLALVTTLRGTHLQILRWQLDTYREVIARTSPEVLAGAATRRRAAQIAYEELLSQGITGFVDRRGRRWELASYVEMATRTTVAQALLEGQLDRLAGAGISLIMVSDSPQECSLCLMPGTVVEGPAPKWRSRLEYTGDVISIATAGGKHLTGTPNHPVLTPRGWVRLDQIRPGDQVISHSGEQRYPGVMPDDVQVPTFIEKAGESRAPLLLAGPTRRDLDRDVAYREVQVVWPNGALLSEGDAALVEPFGDLSLIGGVGRPGLGSGDGDALLGLLGPDGAPAGGVGGLDHASPLLGGGVLPALSHAGAHHGGPLLVTEPGHVGDDGVVLWPGLDSGALQVVADAAGADAECWSEHLGAFASLVAEDHLGGLLRGELAGAGAAAGRLHASRGESLDDLPVADVEGGHELLKRLAGTVAPDEVIDVGVRQYSGHVWDLSTGPAWFVANGIVTHNCRPWEGKVLTRAGLPGERTVQAESAVRSGQVSVEVAGSLAEAIGRGLFHPNCTHNVTAYLPGATRRPTGTENPQGYQDRQRLRALERQVRRKKLLEAGAITPAAKRAARAEVRRAQAAIREHVERTGLIRQPAREQVGVAR